MGAHNWLRATAECYKCRSQFAVTLQVRVGWCRYEQYATGDAITWMTPGPERSRLHRLVPVLLAAAMLGVVAVGCTAWSEALPSGPHQNRGTNAAWLGVEWVDAPHEPGEIAALAEDLDRQRIRVVYVFTSYWKPGAGLTSSHEHAAEFTRAIKAARPALNVQAWLGLPLAEAGGQGGVDLGDAAVRQRIAAFGDELVRKHGFDGVHLDPEPIADGDQGVLLLLDELRRALGQGPTLSIATRRIWPLAQPMPPQAGGLFWSAGYYREVARRADQVALMTYDSALPLPQLYRLWGRLETVAITRTLAGMDVDLFVGIPTSEERTATHWPNAETMASGLAGVVDGLNDASAVPDALTGVAIYPYWETDAAEWATYGALWLGD